MESDRECDGARFSPRPNKSNSHCSVFGCNSRSRREPELRFHSFPNEKSNKRRMKRWAKKLGIRKKITENMKVCSLHFKRSDYFLADTPSVKRYLRNDAVPSCNLPEPFVSKPYKLSDLETLVKRKKKTEKKVKQSDKSTQVSFEEEEEEEEEEEIEEEESQEEITSNDNTDDTISLENDIPTTVDVSTQATCDDFEDDTSLMTINSDQELSTPTGITSNEQLVYSEITCPVPATVFVPLQLVTIPNNNTLTNPTTEETMDKFAPPLTYYFV